MMAANTRQKPKDARYTFRLTAQEQKKINRVASIQYMSASQKLRQYIREGLAREKQA